MRYASIGFHILMLLLLVLAFIGAFSPPRTGNMMHDNGATLMPAVGIVTIWIVGAIILRVMRRISKP